ncbi:MAG: VOC family protein, partial [Planctomycetota bacterium]
MARIHHVLIGMPRGGEEAARSFWCDLVRAELIERPASLFGRGLWFRLGEAEVHVDVNDAYRPEHRAHPAFELDAGAYTALKERLAEVNSLVQQDRRLPGFDRLFVTDPFANRLVFLC